MSNTYYDYLTHSLASAILMNMNNVFRYFNSITALLIKSVAPVGFEPARTFSVQWILSPSCLPIPSWGLITYILFVLIFSN